METRNRPAAPFFPIKTLIKEKAFRKEVVKIVVVIKDDIKEAALDFFFPFLCAELEKKKIPFDETQLSCSETDKVFAFYPAYWLRD